MAIDIIYELYVFDGTEMIACPGLSSLLCLLQWNIYSKIKHLNKFANMKYSVC